MRVLYLDIDTRLRKLEQVREQALATPGGAAGGEPSAPEPQASPAETKAYEAALNQFKLGNYALAISAFQGFLVTYPTSPLASSAPPEENAKRTPARESAAGVVGARSHNHSCSSDGSASGSPPRGAVGQSTSTIAATPASASRSAAA